MPELGVHQATGLLGLAQPSGARLLAMAHHGDAPTELPLLWQLCTALVALGYSVTVLDGTKVETEHNPGLLHYMEYRPGYGMATDIRTPADAPGWAVIPSALGIRSLCPEPAHALDSGRYQRNLQRLGQWFADDGVVVVYAGVDALVGVLGGSACRPLLSMAQEKSSLLTSYTALKRLLQQGQLMPTLVHLTATSAGGLADTVAQCARSYLGYDIQPTTINPKQSAATLRTDMRRLALQMLENAVMLGIASAMPGATGAYRTSGHESRRH